MLTFRLRLDTGLREEGTSILAHFSEYTILWLTIACVTLVLGGHKYAPERKTVETEIV